MLRAGQVPLISRTISVDAGVSALRVRLIDMALFSRRKKTDDAPSESQTPIEADALDEAVEQEQAPSEPVPEIGISVQAFRGVGATAGPEVKLPDPDESKPSSPVAVARPTVPARRAFFKRSNVTSRATGGAVPFAALSAWNGLAASVTGYCRSSLFAQAATRTVISIGIE